MKKAVIISLLLFISMLGYTRAEAKVYYQVGTYKAGKFQYDYKVLEKGIWITKITPLSGKGIATLKIPSKIAGKKVVKLGADGDLVGNMDTPDRDTNLFGVTKYEDELWIVLSPKKINDRVKKIKTIKIPSTVKILTQNCFRYLQDGKNINIPAGVTKNVIGPFTCIKWNKITASDKSKEYKVSNGCLLSRDGKKLYGFVKKKKKIVIPSTVKRIVYDAGDFNGCSTIIIPKSVNKIDKKAISTDQPVKVKIAKGNKRYAVKYGSVYSKVSGRLALGYVNNGVLKIPEKVTRIDHHGLLGRDPEKIIIPASVKKIGDLFLLSEAGRVTYVIKCKKPPKLMYPVILGGEIEGSHLQSYTIYVPKNCKDKYMKQWKFCPDLDVTLVESK